MISIHLNTSSLLAQRSLGVAHSSIATSLERLSTGFKINRAADNAANLAISKGQSCQISGTTVAQENTSQAINLLDTADGTLSKMQDIAGRIRNLSLQAMNGTYSDSERAMMQKEVEQLTQELYRQKSSCKFNELEVLGKTENAPATLSLESGANLATVSTLPQKGTSGVVGTTGSVGTYAVDKLTEEEAVKQGYTVIKTADQLNAIPANTSGKYILMGDIDMTGVSHSAKTFAGEFNGNGYKITGLSSNLFDQNRGTIKNVTLANVSIEKNSSQIASLVANNYGLVENCSADGSVSSTSTIIAGLVANNQRAGIIRNCSFSGVVSNTSAITGGLVARNDGIIENSTVSATITGRGENTGGISGYSDGIVRNCLATVDITSNSGFTGGLIGYGAGEISNCTSNSTINSKSSVGGLVGYFTEGRIINSSASGKIIAESSVGGLAGILLSNNCDVENSKASVNIEATSAGGFVGQNNGTITNCEALGNVNLTGTGSAFVVANNGTIANSKATGNVISTGSRVAGIAASNASTGIITNSSYSGEITASGDFSGGIVGQNQGTISTSSAVGTINSSGKIVGGAVGSNYGKILKSFSEVDINATGSGGIVGGLVGQNISNSSEIENCYSTGNVLSAGGNVGGLVGINENLVENSYATGDVQGVTSTGSFCGKNSGSGTISNSYATGELNVASTQNAFLGTNSSGSNAIQNCYVDKEKNSEYVTDTAGVKGEKSAWFNDSSNLAFLGGAYDYYYTPPGLLNNPTDHPEEYSQFQIGSNSGEKNMIELNLVFRMNFYSANISTSESAEISIKNTDAFIDRISQKRSEIGATRNKLDSVMQSQAIKLENLSSSHSTMMDTDFASETAKLTRQQILQQATSSLLSQANMQPNIALRLLGG